MAEPILLVPSEVREEIEKKMKTEDIVSRKIDGTSYKFRRISMKLSNLFYYTNNVRTTDSKKEHIKDNNLPEDTFSREKMLNHVTQKAYHPIILKEAMKEKDKMRYQFGDRDNPGHSSQTEEIYINKDGIIFNGNTRSAWWREFETEHYHSVNCLVFEDLEKEEEIYPVVNKLDPPKDQDIRQDIRWYNYILQAIDNRSEGIIDEEKEARNANLELEEYQKYMKMYSLAKEFLDQEFPSYEKDKFSTLKSSRGGGDGNYVWSAFADGMGKLEKEGLPEGIRHAIKMDAWGIIIDTNSESPNIPGQAYKQINKLFSPTQLNRYKKEFQDLADDSGTLLDDESTDYDIPEADELIKRGGDRLDDISDKDAIDRDKTNKNAFGEGIKALTKKLKQYAANNLRSGYNRDLAVEEFSKLESEIVKVKKLLDKKQN